MAFRLFGRGKAAEPLRPYAGATHPEGAFGAVPLNGEIVMDLEPGIVQGIFRVAGRPSEVSRNQDGQASWTPAQVTIEVKPADEGTPRLLPVEYRRAWRHQELRRSGWSEKAILWVEVPEPGGRYRARLSGTPKDHEEHLLFTQRDGGGPLLARLLDRAEGRA